MSNPSKAKGDRFEWDTIGWAEGFLAEVGSPLRVERTRAGYQRDWGDILVQRPDDTILSTLQLKNRREWNISAWTDQTVRQQTAVRARFGALFVKRPRVLDPGRTFAIMPANEYLRLLVQLDRAERELTALDAENQQLAEQVSKTAELLAEQTGELAEAQAAARLVRAAATGTLLTDPPGTGHERLS